MIIVMSKNSSSTITGWKTEGQTEFYGHNAAKAARVAGSKTELLDNRYEFWGILDQNFDAFCSRAVAKGYKLEINL